MRTKPIKACLALIAAAFAAGQTAQAQQITAAMAVPNGATRVDTTKPGMLMRVYKGANPPMTVPNVNFGEAYISGFVHNPDSRTAYPTDINRAGLNFEFDTTTPPQPLELDSTRWWIMQTVNVSDTAGGNPSLVAGVFTPTATASPTLTRTDTQQYGIQNGGDNYYAVEYTGYIHVATAGNYRFGVNSDDGFRLYIGNGVDFYAQPGTTPAGVMLMENVGTRGMATGTGNGTEVQVNNIPVGFYPFRLVWFENEGGNAGCEFYHYTVGATAASVNKILVNDSTLGNSLKVYYKLNDAPPQITGRYPLPNTSNVEARPILRAMIENGAVPVDRASVVVKIDNNVISGVEVGDPNDGSLTSTRIVTPPTGPFLPASVHTVNVAGSTTGGTPFSFTWSFTVANYPTVPTAFNIGGADNTKPGFRLKLEHNQNINTGPQTSVAWAAERRLAKGFNDPATGQPYPNLADLSTADAEGYYTDADVINYNDTAGTTVANFPNDEAHPGGLVAASERFVFGIETILELPAGIYRLGVNSDDGFRLTAGRAPGDVAGLEIMKADADRGPTDTTGDINVTADGFYPFRLVWWETGGGAAAEFFLVRPDGTKILINDTANANTIKAWRESANTPPAVTRTLPVVNEPHAYADQDVIIDITERGFPVDLDSIVLKINTVVQNITKTRSGNVVSIVRDSSVDYLLPSGANNVVLTYSYTPTGGSATTVDVPWTFTVPRYTRVVPAGNRVPAEQVTGSGFTLFQANHLWRGGTSQADAGRYVQNGGNGNNIPGPEIQLARGYLDLAGLPFQNLTPAPYNAGPSTDNVYPVLNFNTANGGGTGNTGFMNGDVQIPFNQGVGGPGTPTDGGRDNFVHEYFTYMQLKKGAHIFGVNVDDGFSLHSSPNPRDTLGTLLGWKDAPGGQLGFPFSGVAFNVVVPEDGIYPMRLLFWEGSSDARIEFMALDRDTGRLSVVNNEDQTAMLPTQPAIPAGGAVNQAMPPYTPYKTFSAYTGPVRPWTKFSVYPIRSEAPVFNNPIQQTGPGPITIRLPNNTSYAGIANDSTQQRPFGDAVGGVVADLGTGEVGLKVDGQTVPVTVTDLGNGDKEVKFTPAQPLTPGAHTAALIYAGVENVWVFNTINHVNVAADAAIPASRAVTDKRGFLAKVVQSTTARPGANSGNSVASAEAQLTGTPANVAPANPNREDGRYVVPGVINMNVNKNSNPTGGADLGNFTAARSTQPDDPFPAIAAANLLHFTVEYTGYLELPAGYQKFGWGGDDGVQIEIRAPGAPTGQVLLTMDRGAGERDFPFAFVTPTAGLYPVRILYYQGTGGGNLELFTYGPNGSKILVNDPNNPAAVKAYYEVTAGQQQDPEIRIVSFTGGVLSITWTNGGELFTADSIGATAGTTVWTGTGNSSGSAQINVGAGNKFLRIQRAN